MLRTLSVFLTRCLRPAGGRRHIRRDLDHTDVSLNRDRRPELLREPLQAREDALRHTGRRRPWIADPSSRKSDGTGRKIQRSPTAASVNGFVIFSFSSRAGSQDGCP